MTTVVRVAAHGHLLNGGSVHTLSGNADLNYGGGNNQAARIKERGDYNVWDDDWQKNP